MDLPDSDKSDRERERLHLQNGLKMKKKPILRHFWAQIGPKNLFFENRAPS